MILLDPRGNEMRRIAGLVDVDGLLRHLNEARRSPYTFREARRSAARDPSNVRANWKVAEAYLGDGREELAEPYLRNIIAHDEPNRYGHTDNAMFALGFLLGRKGKYGRAIYCLETLLERWPRFKDRDKALYVLGVSQLARGNTQQGRQTLARLQDEFPGSNAANAARKSVQAMPPERKNN